jgi:hypothetical protein
VVDHDVIGTSQRHLCKRHHGSTRAGGITVELLQEAKELAVKAGGIQRQKRVVDVLAE